LTFLFLVFKSSDSLTEEKLLGALENRVGARLASVEKEKIKAV